MTSQKKHILPTLKSSLVIRTKNGLPRKFAVHVRQLYANGQRDKNVICNLKFQWSGASQNTIMLIATCVWLTPKTLTPKQSMRQVIQISHQLEVQLTIVLKYPFPYFLACLICRVKTSAVHKDEDDMVTDLDFHISTSLEPSPFKQEKLSDFVRDLCLSKQQSKVLASRLQPKALLYPDTKVTFYRNRKTKFLQNFTSEDDFAYCHNVKRLC